MKILALLALAAVITTSGIEAGFCDGPLPHSTPFPAEGIKLGMGWDTYKGTQALGRGTCIEAKEVDQVARTWDRVDYTEASDTSSLMQSFSVSAEAKVGSIPGGGGGASASFSHSIKIETSGLNIAVNQIIVDETDFLVAKGLGLAVLRANARAKSLSRLTTSPILSVKGAAAVGEDDPDVIHLTRAARDALRSPDPEEFRKRCGDAFVATILKGAGIMGVYSIATRSEAERSTFKGKVDGSYAIVSGSAAAESDVQKLETEHRIGVHYFQLGAPGLPTATTDKQFRDKVSKISETANAHNAAPFAMGLVKYADLVGVATWGADLGDAEAIANQYYRLKTIYDEASNMITGSDYYYDDQRTSVANVKVIQDAVKNDMATLVSALKACRAAKIDIPSSTHKKNHIDCVYPGGSFAKDDYGYRMMLPVRKQSVSEWVELQGAAASVKAYTAKLKEVGDRPYGTHSQEYKDVLAALARWRQVVKRDTNADSTEYRYRTWIDEPSRARCLNGEADDIACLSNGRLDSIRVEMSKASLGK